MTDPIRTPHDEAEELLPWYATGQLDAGERSRLEAHLSDCADCRGQLTIERRIVEQFQALTPEVNSGWARLKRRIEAPVAPRRTPITEAAAEFWHILTRPAVAALATAQVAFVAFAATILPSMTTPAYQALGSAPPPSSANVIVMFRPEATEFDIRGALNATGASLVGGPTPANAYLLHVPEKGRATALAKLRDDDEVTLAEPIDGVAS
jgi:anti-sigma factor RsiW